MKRVKHLVRTLSATPSAMSGSDSSADVEKELSVYFEGGWELFSTHVVSSSRDTVTVLYVLTKEEFIVPMKNIKVEDVLEAEVVQHAKRGRPAKNVEVPLVA